MHDELHIKLFAFKELQPPRLTSQPYCAMPIPARFLVSLNASSTTEVTLMIVLIVMKFTLTVVSQQYKMWCVYIHTVKPENVVMKTLFWCWLRLKTS